MINTSRLYKKGQFVKIDIDSLNIELKNNISIVKKSLHKNVRDDDFYKQHFLDFEKSNNELIENCKKENPKITKIVDDSYINIIFRDGSEYGVDINHIILLDEKTI